MARDDADVWLVTTLMCGDMQRRKKNLEEMLNAGLLSHAFPNVSRVLKTSKVTAAVGSYKQLCLIIPILGQLAMMQYRRFIFGTAHEYEYPAFSYGKVMMITFIFRRNMLHATCAASDRVFLASQSHKSMQNQRCCNQGTRVAATNARTLLQLRHARCCN